MEALIIAQNAFREHRNMRLAETDWAVLPDSPLSESKKASYLQYRQYLRSLPNTATEEDFMTFKGIPAHDEWVSAQSV